MSKWVLMKKNCVYTRDFMVAVQFMKYLAHSLTNAKCFHVRPTLCLTSDYAIPESSAL